MNDTQQVSTRNTRDTAVRTWRGRQSLEGEFIDLARDPHLRARIGRDSHDDQSHAIVEVWTERGWTELDSRPIRAMRIASTSYVARDGWRPDMLADLQELIDFGRRFLA